MRGVKAKRLRKLGLKSRPVEREERPRTIGLVGWERTHTAVEHRLGAQARAEAKRARRRERNAALAPLDPAGASPWEYVPDSPERRIYIYEEKKDA